MFFEILQVFLEIEEEFLGAEGAKEAVGEESVLFLEGGAYESGLPALLWLFLIKVGVLEQSGWGEGYLTSVWT